MKSTVFLSLGLLWILALPSCESGSFDESQRTPAAPGEEATNDQEARKPVTDDGGRADDNKTFTDYCFDIEDQDSPDPQLKATIDAVLDLTNETLCGAASTKAARIDPLDLSGTGISDLRPLRKLGGIVNLDLSNNSITDISVLSTLKSLKSVNLAGNPVSDLSALSDLGKLDTLNLEMTSIESLEAVSSLTGIKTLNLSRNDSFTDVSALGALMSLEVLDLSNTNTASLSGLDSLSSLRQLYVISTDVEDVSPVAGLMSLTLLAGERSPIVSEATEQNCPTNATSPGVRTFCAPLVPAP